MKSFKKGFTLIELLIVIVIIGILATIAIINYNGARQRANDASLLSALTDASNVANSCILDGKAPGIVAGSAVCPNAGINPTAVWPVTPTSGDVWTPAITVTGTTNFSAVYTSAGTIGSPAAAKKITCTVAGCVKSPAGW